MSGRLAVAERQVGLGGSGEHVIGVGDFTGDVV
jgi:hypothetical protein